MQIDLDEILKHGTEPPYEPDKCKERNWNDGEFVERYLRGYLILFKMNLDKTTQMNEQFVKESKKSNKTQNKLLIEIKRLNNNFGNIILKYEQMKLEFHTVRERVELLVKQVDKHFNK